MILRTGPVHRNIVAIDIERSTARTNLIKLELRAQIYRMLTEAMTASGIGKDHCEPLIDRGDGILALIQPVDEVPRSRLLEPLVPELTGRLLEYRAAMTPHERNGRELRLRMVVHAGDILRDGHGPVGDELDLAFRLLDAVAVKRRLRDTPAPLVVVVSQRIYESVVQQRYDGLSPESYRRVHVKVGDSRRFGWVHVPGESTSPKTLEEVA